MSLRTIGQIPIDRYWVDCAEVLVFHGVLKVLCDQGHYGMFISPVSLNMSIASPPVCGLVRGKVHEVLDLKQSP